jgi:hypothetical protein
MNHLVETLRIRSQVEIFTDHFSADLMAKAADEIDRLQLRRAESL